MAKYRLKNYLLEDLLPGMEIGKLVLTDDNKVILSEGTVLTQSMIEGLNFWEITEVCIREELLKAPSVNFAIPATESQKKFYQGYEDTVSVIKDSFSKMRFFKEVPLAAMQELADQSIDPLISSIGVLNHLHMVRRQDDYTFHHSVNVSIICGVLGKWLGYSGQELKDLILAGLLHDVGKTQIPVEILNKPGKLSPEEMETMKLHTTRGYQMVREISNIPPGVGYGILQHHEKADGTGYPFRVKDIQIHAYAKVIAIADIYDAMTSDRVYHRKATPFAVAEMLFDEMYGKLDPAICTVFLNNVRDYFIGNIVELSDGREAEVIYLGQYLASRPVVYAQDGESIDLEKRKDVSIIRLVRA
ncbi:MAG TPA: HD-GYP domain-containing protein [Methylomusa anaerophila]|uniref:Cyclic di-GMP phosphodiesterase response regulator RpfG n=1 Tax=Methylomusa anaerophila TaxID=1930071 RepID=A0A348AQF5_9FIRM|nr:HD-GYP domain-containing protein [Methylomusa anaerophila]BBB93303.1 cyclic di-GMP phosphodiesterase response regulator RpfG [Methylomusa anaerophila]HML86866.1 HD-GYP domain-containing protein [Methylomusa anaerophila]